jgi:hypothetical protein
VNERELRFHYPPHQDEYNSVFPPNVTVITGGVSQEQKRPKMLQILGLCGIGRVPVRVALLIYMLIPAKGDWVSLFDTFMH